jgi:hypothetical protein
MNRFISSHDFVTCRRSPEVSSTAFDAQPPDLPPVSLMDMGFAIICPLARHRRPHIRFLFIGSRLCSTLLSGPASRRVLFHPCASLRLHLHQVVEGTFTLKLSNVLGTQSKRQLRGCPGFRGEEISFTDAPDAACETRRKSVRQPESPAIHTKSSASLRGRCSREERRLQR